MKLTVLGSGAFIPTIKRGNPGFFLEAEEKKILIDCGSGTLRQIVKAKKDFKNLDALIISHFHLDHVTDLGLLLETYNLLPDFVRKKDLRIIASSGFRQFFDKLVKIFPGIRPRPNTYQIIFDQRKVIDLDGLLIRTKPGNHTSDTITTSIKDKKNKEIVYTSDTLYDPDLAEFTNRPDLLITECTFPKEAIGQKHLYPKTAGELASSVKAKKLLLVHLSMLTEKIDLKREVKKYYQGEIVIAEDSLTLAI